ncbi:MAG: PhoH family protein [Desulfovibrio sp.]|jgi:phosphate starvation-inducible PhoH-like protein|nr:PhoH family protein [Desulfovibrio sp.]
MFENKACFSAAKAGDPIKKSALANSDPASLSPADAGLAEQNLNFEDPAFARELFGPRNANLDTLARRSGLHIAACGSRVTLRGEARACALTRNLLLQLYDLLHTGLRLNPQDLPHAYAVLEKKPDFSLTSLYGEAVFSANSRRNIVARTLNQREYASSLHNNELTFAVGPAGTGKTYLAVATALSMLLSKKVRRIILTRPAVEAGERLGFLPGDLAEKVNPYLRPLYDALHDMLVPEKIAEMIAGGIIEIAPLAFMRGRTLNDAFIILDEAQNTTPEQMKMFVTRLGFGARAAVTGDITQIDLPKGPDGIGRSGLVQVLQVLRDVEGVSMIHFHTDDVIRHPLVARIVEAYDNYQTHSGQGQNRPFPAS